MGNQLQFMKKTLPSAHQTGDSANQHLRGMLIVGVGVLAISFDAVLIRLAQTDGWNIAFWRGALIAFSLGLFLTFRHGWQLATAFREGRWTAFISAILFGITSLLFVLSIMHTRAANTVVILSAAPLFAALFTRLFLGEVVRLHTWAAIIVAVGGVVIVFYGSLGGDGLLGDVFAITAAGILGGNLTLLRHHRTIPRIPLVCVSGAVTALIALPFAEPLSLAPQSYWVLAVMGLVQMPTAMVLMAVGTRYLPAPEVSLFLLVEAVLGPAWVWVAVGEEPPGATFVGGFVIIATLTVHSWLGLRSMRWKTSG